MLVVKGNDNIFNMSEEKSIWIIEFSGKKSKWEGCLAPFLCKAETRCNCEEQNEICKRRHIWQQEFGRVPWTQNQEKLRIPGPEKSQKGLDEIWEDSEVETNLQLMKGVLKDGFGIERILKDDFEIFMRNKD